MGYESELIDNVIDVSNESNAVILKGSNSRTCPGRILGIVGSIPVEL